MASRVPFNFQHGAGQRPGKKTATIVIDFRKHPYAADNIWNAQKGGWSQELTFRRLTKKDGRVIRRRTMEYEVNGSKFRTPIIPGCDRDEYPMACTYEGTCPTPQGRQVWVGHIPASENRSVGAIVMNVIKKKGLQDGDKLIFRVINHLNDSPATAINEEDGGIEE